MQFTDYLEPAYKTLSDIQLRCHPIATVVEKGRSDLYILVQIEAVQVSFGVVVRRVFNDVHHLFRLHLCREVDVSLDEEHDATLLDKFLDLFFHREHHFSRRND